MRLFRNLKNKRSKAFYAYLKSKNGGKKKFRVTKKESKMLARMFRDPRKKGKKGKSVASAEELDGKLSKVYALRVKKKAEKPIKARLLTYPIHESCTEVEKESLEKMVK